MTMYVLYEWRYILKGIKMKIFIYNLRGLLYPQIDWKMYLFPGGGGLWAFLPWNHAIFVVIFMHLKIQCSGSNFL